MIQFVGDLRKATECLRSMDELLEGSPPKVSGQNYDAGNVDESMCLEYRSWGFDHRASGLNLVRGGNIVTNTNFAQNNILATGISDCGPSGAEVTGRGGT
ncbi:unnamed protein product [Trichobilharzia szidati]|nr:unnamed protein product [Trichobilharzia szidati]